MKAILLKRPEACIKLAVLLGFVTTILLTWQLWISDRSFPLSPVISSFNFTGDGSEILILFFVGLLLLLCFTNNQILFGITFLIFVVLVLLDLNRLQTWCYIFMLIVAPLFLVRDRESAFSILRILIMGIYCWSAIHKLNDYFIEDVGIKMLKGIFQLSDSDAHRFKFISYIFPFTELLLSFGLFFQLSRNISVILILFMHVFICLIFIPFVNPTNYIIIPWNITMMLTCLVLFYNYRSPIFNRFKLGVISMILALLVWICPIGNYFNTWPYTLSFSLYASKNRSFYVAISDKYWPVFEPTCSKYIVPLPEGTQGGVIINMDAWAEKELHILMFPEIYSYKKACYYFCNKGIPATDIQFMSYDHKIDPSSLMKWNCGD